jgi:hypothetical protein
LQSLRTNNFLLLSGFLFFNLRNVIFNFLDENKPIWMHAEEREECKVRLYYFEEFSKLYALYSQSLLT